MKMFVLKFVMLVALMFFSVLYGIHYANKGIVTMRGYSPFSVEELADEGIHTSLFGNDLAEKKKQLEAFEAYNLFSSAGKKLSETITQITKNGIGKINDLLKKTNEKQE